MKELVSKELRLGCIATPIAIPLGGVIVFLVMGIVMLDFGSALSILALSIICTAGISLILWIPIWYAVGYGALIALRAVGIDLGALLIRKQLKPVPADSPPPRPALSRDQLALLNYINKARAKGLSDAQISQNLISHGWQAKSVTAAFQLAERGT